MSLARRMSAGHEPLIIPSLVEMDCRADACDHSPGDCPTRGAAICSACSQTEPAIGDVTFPTPWPCQRRASDQQPASFIDVVFDGPPAPEAGRFVEVETSDGHSIDAGEWIDRGDGMWALRIQTPSSEFSNPTGPR